MKNQNTTSQAGERTQEIATYCTGVPSARRITPALLATLQAVLDGRYTNNPFRVAKVDSRTLGITGPANPEAPAMARDFVADWLSGYFHALK